MERRGVRPSSEEFGRAFKTYGEVLEACHVPPEDIQRQITGILKSTISSGEQAESFVSLTQNLQTRFSDNGK